MNTPDAYFIAGWFGMGLTFSRWYFVGLVLAGFVLIALRYMDVRRGS